MFGLNKLGHSLAWVLGKPLLKFFLGLEITGEENLKGLKGPLIVAFNHSSWLDAFLIFAAIPPTSKIAPVRFAVWEGHYKKPLLRLFLALEGSFPVTKGLGPEKSLKTALEILKRGGIVGIAPEERRRHLGRPRKARRGVAFLTIKTGVPVLPIFIESAIGLKIAEVLGRKKRIRVKIGKVFYPTQHLSHQDLTNLSNLIMKRVYQMKGGETNERS